jgi:hypothetical protein
MSGTVLPPPPNLPLPHTSSLSNLPPPPPMHSHLTTSANHLPSYSSGTSGSGGLTTSHSSDSLKSDYSESNSPTNQGTLSILQSLLIFFITLYLYRT